MGIWFRDSCQGDITMRILNTFVVSGAVAVGSAIAGGVGAVAGAVGGWAAANAGAIKGVADAAGTVTSMQEEQKQAKKLKKQQASQKREISKQKRETLERRKLLVNDQRKQIMGSGDSGYSIGQTGDTGVAGSSMTGDLLG